MSSFLNNLCVGTKYAAHTDNVVLIKAVNTLPCSNLGWKTCRDKWHYKSTSDSIFSIIANYKTQHKSSCLSFFILNTVVFVS